MLPPLDISTGVAHSEEEESLPLLADANFCRRKQARRNPVAQFFKILGDLVESKGQVTGHVFEKDDPWFSFTNDASDMGPQMARIILSTSFASKTEGLTRVARSECIHDSTPRAAVKGLQIRPYRRFIQATCFHCLSQDFDGSGFVFHTTDCANIPRASCSPRSSPAPPVQRLRL